MIILYYNNMYLNAQISIYIENKQIIKKVQIIT